MRKKRKLTTRQNRRRYYLHRKAREQMNNVRVDAQGRMIHISYLAEKTGKYVALLQREFDYGVQTEIQ